MAKTILVTGATDGIGRETALELARLGHRVIAHGRSAKKVEAVVEELEKSGAKADGAVADLASFESVRKLAAELKKKGVSLDVLLNNAGVFVHERALTVDGHEVTFQVNHLSPFLLTNLLLPQLAKGARVVNVSSIAHRRGRLDFDDLDLARGFDGYTAYANSKLANVLFTFELARRVSDKGITSNCLHPGVIGTKLLREGFGSSGAPVERGAKTTVYVATAPELEGVSGRYYADAQEAEVAPQANDRGAQERLWDVSAKLVGLS